MHVKTLKDEVLLQIAEDLDMVGDLCHFKEIEGIQTWEPWKIRAIVSKLDDLGWIKRPEAEVYFSNTYGWCVEGDGISRYELSSERSAYEYCKAMGYEPVEMDID